MISINKKKVFIIAEIGINHNGSLDVAKKLIISAKQAGADAVKLQKRDINLVYSKEDLETPRESPWGTTTRQQKEGLEFSKKDYEELYEFSKKQNIDFFASAWDLNSLDFLKNFNFNSIRLLLQCMLINFF